MNRTLLHLLTNLADLAGGDGDFHHLRRTILSQLREGYQHLIGSLGEASHILLGIQTELTCGGGKFHKCLYRRARVHFLEVV